MNFSFHKKPQANAENAQPQANGTRPMPTEAQKAASRRTLKNGAYASLMAIVMLVAVILINLVAGAIPTKYTQFDISSAGLFTLSDTTKTMLSTLNKDVKAYYMAESGSEDANVTRMLNRYASESSHFTWEQRDPAIYPTFAKQYGAEDASSGSVILVCGDKNTLVDNSSIYQVDYSDYYSSGTASATFNAESAFTSGIAKVTSDTSYKMYQLTGHGEASLESDFTDTLSNSNTSIEELNLLTAQSIPDDAAAVLIDCPQVDYTADTVSALKDYLAKGGKLLVTTSLDYATPNLDALLAEYGMSRQDGLVIETTQGNYYRAQNYLLPTVQSNDITSGMTSGLYVFLPSGQGIVTDDSKENLTLTPLLATSAKAYSMVDYATAETAQQGENDPSGPFNMAVAAEDSTTNAKVVWINCGTLFTNNVDQVVSGGNAQFFGSIANWMNGAENAVAIDAKSISSDTLTVPSMAIIVLGLLFTILLPVALIVTGIVVFALRRRR
jgi:ABC-2 type transport system permease protein